MNHPSTFGTQKKTVTVESVIPLESSQLNEIISQLDLDPNHYVVNNRHNPSLIAGIRIIIAGKIIDLSFQHQLNQLTDN